MQKKRVICYVDGFNLYHAVDALGTKYNFLKWLNLWGLASAFIVPSREELSGVYYFSAIADWLADAAVRHRFYIRALEANGVTPILGKFKSKPRSCHVCGAAWTAHEEKQSDVNIAAYLVHHAHLDLYDRALVVTSDSDLCNAIDLVLNYHPGKSVTVLVPPHRYAITNEIRNKAVRMQKIKIRHLANNLLAETVVDAQGKLVARRPKKYDP